MWQLRVSIRRASALALTLILSFAALAAPVQATGGVLAPGSNSQSLAPLFQTPFELPDYTVVPLNDPNVEYVAGVAINNSKQVAGGIAYPDDGTRRAFIWDGGTLTKPLGDVPSFANDINEAGHIVGNCRRSDGETHAFLLGGGELTDLG